jgi:hypothetical protein
VKDIDQIIVVTKVAVQAVELLETGIKAALTAIGSAKAQLKDVLHDAQQMRDKIAGDRAAADTALEDKFR